MPEKTGARPEKKQGPGPNGSLHRIDDGTYGVCTVCGQLIRKPRLLNQPFVLTCMECQSEMERGAK